MPKTTSTTKPQRTSQRVSSKTPVAEAISPESYAAQFEEMLGDLKLPSGRRMLVSVCAQFTLIGTGIYSGIQIGALLAVGAAVLTGSSFLAFLAMFMSVAIATYTSIVAAARVGKYIALGEIDNDIAKAKLWVGNSFVALRNKLSEARHA